jgi:glycosyltransferase involved in cell wall biosynthesis
VSVCIPCFNYGQYVAGAVASVLDQPSVDLEVIVVDDASTDGSDEVVRSLDRIDDRITTILHPINRGHIATFNDALGRASGEYVVLMSADDMLTPGSLARAVALMEAHPSVGFVYGDPLHFTGAPPRPRVAVSGWSVWEGRDWVERRCRSGYNCMSSPEVVMRASVQHTIGRYDASVPHTSDLHMWLRAATVADVGRVNGAHQAFYRVHDASMQRTINAGLLFDLEERRAAFESALAGARGRLAGVDDLLDVVRRRLAQQALDLACRAYERRHTGDIPVEALVDFAASTWPRATELPQWRALERRRAMGVAWAPRAFFVRSVHRRLGEEVARRRWQRTGER